MSVKHALLGASNSKRWLACTPSARLEESVSEQSSDYAAEGTFAHAYGETRLAGILGKEVDTHIYDLQRNSFYSQSLEDYIEEYVSIVLEKWNDALTRDTNAQIFLELKLDYSRWVREGFGTGDVVIIADGILEVIDLKYGAGVPVSAIDNPQLKLYGLGAWSEFIYLYDIQTIRVTIVQPRLDSISSEDITAFDLVSWADEYVRPRAELAFEGKGECISGSHCQFCKVAATCRARADYNLELVKYNFKSADLLENYEIGDILKRAEQFTKWLGDVQKYVFEKALSGEKFEGWKLVEGRANRKYSNEETVAIKLLAEGFKDDKIYNKNLLGIGDMETLLGKKNFSSILGDLIIKPNGKPTLVEESDKRQEINVTSGFKDHDDDSFLE